MSETPNRIANDAPIAFVDGRASRGLVVESLIDDTRAE